MGKYKKRMLPAGIAGIFIVLAVPLSLYILSLPLQEIRNEGCNGFSTYQLANCIAYYQRLGDVALLQRAAQTSLWVLWSGLFLGVLCSCYLFPRLSLSSTSKVSILFLGFLIASLLAGFPLILLSDLLINGLFFALALIIGFLTLELTLVSALREDSAREEYDVTFSDSGT